MPRLPTEYFDALYEGSDDPWQMATSPYEAAKYAATVAALPRPRYASGLEIGCAVGVLSGALADRCARLVAVDVAEAALERARQRNRHRGNLRFVRAAFGEEAIPGTPPGGFDLIILSEVLYYFDAAMLQTVADAARAIAAPGADILLVHWLGPTPDYPQTGDAAADGFIAALSGDARVVSQSRTPDYRIDLLRA